VNILVIGAGAIGCLIGAKLAISNQPVTLVGRAHFVEAVRARGMLLADATGRHTVRNLRAAADLQTAFARAEGAFDLAILTVKSYDTAAALDELRSVLAATGAPAPAVLSLQNGVGNEATICAAFATVAVLAGSITTPVSSDAPGSIRVDKPRYSIGLSQWRGGADSMVFADVAERLSQAGFTVKRYSNAEGMKWTKLLMNIMGNAIFAILDEPPEVIFADRKLVDLEIEAWRETLAVMAAAQIPAINMDKHPFAQLAPLIRHAPSPLIRPLLRSQIGGARGGKMPSLYLDLQNGRPKNEVLWLNGAVVKRGAQVGISTPVNRTYTDVLLSLVAHPDQRAGWKGNHARLLAKVEA